MAVVIPFALQRRPHEARSCPFPQRTADIDAFIDGLTEVLNRHRERRTQAA